jgi:uracil-DNA glycosylase family 4
MKSKNEGLRVIYDEFKDCSACGISKYRDRVVVGTGNVHASILIVTDYPTPSEERVGHHNTSDIRFLVRAFKHAIKSKSENDQLLSNVFITNAVSCCPRISAGDLSGEPKSPSWPEIRTCRTRLLRTIYAVDPHIVIAAGKYACMGLLGRNKDLPTRDGRLASMFHFEVPGELLTLTYGAVPTVDPHVAQRSGDYDDPNGKVASLVSALKGAWEISSYIESEDL